MIGIIEWNPMIRIITAIPTILITFVGIIACFLIYILVHPPYIKGRLRAIRPVDAP